MVADTSNNTTDSPGFLVIDKPAGMTSHDVVEQVRRTLDRQRVGHAGTLDPFATGILLVLIGSATRLMEYVHLLPKTYEAELTLGATSDTDDLTGTLTTTSKYRPAQIEIDTILKSFVGNYEQMPPRYAAIKVKGKKLYEYARAGESITTKLRPVTIQAIERLKYEYPILTIKVVCSTGTYIRALGRDIGEKLTTGAHVSALQRTAIGQFELNQAWQLTDISPQSFPQALHPVAELVSHLPTVTLSDDNVVKLRQGRAVEWDKSDTLTSNQPLVLLTGQHKLIGIGSYEPATRLLSPHKILF
jgi:tRNA pseudouridine55 synthase